MRLRRAIRCTLEHPRATVAAFLLLSAGWLPFVAGLRLETDGRDLFSPRDPAIRWQDEVDREYASSDFLVVGLEALPGHELWAPAPLNAVLRLSQRLAVLPGVEGEDLRSLATEFSPEWIDGALHLAPPIRETVRDPAQVEAVRRAALREPLFARVLLAVDGRGTAIYLPLALDADRRALYHQVEALLREEWQADPALASGYRFHLLGPAAAESLLGEHVLTDLGRLLPLAFLVVAATLWFWFRQGSVVCAGLGEGGSIVLWTLGLMAALGKPISLVTVVMPVILVTYCVADTIHLAQHFSARCAASADRSFAGRVEAMDRTLDEVLSPVTFTSLTTAVGFFSIAVSPIPPLRDFGLFSGLGVLIALAVSVFVVPASLLAGGFGRRAAGVSGDGSPRFGRQLAALSTAAARAPWTVVAATALLTTVLGLGALKLEIQDSWLQNFSAGSPLVRSDEWFNRGFFGSNVVNAVLTPPVGTVHDPAFLAEVKRLQRELGELGEVGGSLSLADSLEAVARSLEGASRLPRDRRESEGWAMLYRMAGGSNSLDSYVAPGESSTNLWVFLNQADYRRTAVVVAALSRFDWRLAGEARPDVRLAGDAYLSYRLVDSIARSQRRSAFAALLMTFLTVLWMLRSVATSVLAVVPVALSVIWNFGFMGWSGLPLGVATSTFCAIAFGIGVDFALHWIARLRLGLERGLGWEEAIRFTGRTTGGAMLLQGLVLVLGFGVLLLSEAPPNRALSLVLTVNLAACLGASLLLLPAMATLLARRLGLAGVSARLVGSAEASV